MCAEFALSSSFGLLYSRPQFVMDKYLMGPHPSHATGILHLGPSKPKGPALSEEIAQSTVYHRLRQICVYLHFTIMPKVSGVTCCPKVTPQSDAKTTCIILDR